MQDQLLLMKKNRVRRRLFYFTHCSIIVFSLGYSISELYAALL